MSSGSSKSGGKRANMGKGTYTNPGKPITFNSAGVATNVSAQSPKPTPVKKQAAPAAQPVAQQPQAQSQSPVAPPPPRQRKSNMTTSQFAAMNDNKKADIISKSVSQGVPAHLADNAFQRFLYNNGMNDTPDIVSEVQLNKMKGQEVFRTVNAIYSKAIDVNYSAPDIGKQILGGKATRVSDIGGSMYGRGIYFATTRSNSIGYGDYPGDLQKTAVIHAKLNSKAKVISYNQAWSDVNAEVAKGTKFGKELKKCDTASRISIYAMSKGYNVIANSAGGMCVLDRSALTCSNKFTTM